LKNRSFRHISHKNFWPGCKQHLDHLLAFEKKFKIVQK
jgi:hypothetical protein